MNRTKRMKKSIEEYYHNKDAELMSRTFAISAITATVVSVIIVCNADRIAHAFRGANSSVKHTLKTSSDYFKDKISQVVETGEEKIEAVKTKVNNLKKEVTEGFKKADDSVEDVKDNLEIELLQGIENVTDGVDYFIEELKED